MLADSPALPGEMALVSAQENLLVTHKNEKSAAEMELDTLCAASLVEMHRTFTTRLQFLQQGRQLLLLTAKFSMLKENDTLNEDTEGNRNVVFHNPNQS